MYKTPVQWQLSMCTPPVPISSFRTKPNRAVPARRDGHDGVARDTCDDVVETRQRIMASGIPPGIRLQFWGPRILRLEGQPQQQVRIAKKIVDDIDGVFMDRRLLDRHF